MKIFDAQIRSDTRPDSDLENLAYFDTEHVVSTAHAAESFRTAEDLINYFSRLTSEELTRLQRLGLNAHMSLGVLPSARPDRAFDEIWHDLPYLIKQPQVVALGEIGAWRDHKKHWALLKKHVEIGLAYDGEMPLIVTPPRDFQANMTYKMMDRFVEWGYPPELIMMNRLSRELVEAVIHEGFCAGLSVGASSLSPRDTAQFLVDLIEESDSTDRIILNTSLRAGGGDVLGIPKTVVELQQLGMRPPRIEKLIYGNAKALFLRDQPNFR